MRRRTLCTAAVQEWKTWRTPPAVSMSAACTMIIPTASSAVWTAEGEGGAVEVTFRYSAWQTDYHTDGHSDMFVYVNGEKYEVAFPGTGGWDSLQRNQTYGYAQTQHCQYDSRLQCGQRQRHRT